MSKAIPIEFQTVVGNVADHFSMPQVAVNSLLQGYLDGFGLATSRFVINTVLEFGGLVDAASAVKVPDHETDFGETLYVWGVGEGTYVELPFIGTSTRRDTAGRLVELFANPPDVSAKAPVRIVAPKWYGRGL